VKSNIVPPPEVLANAIHGATGVRLNRLPIIPRIRHGDPLGPKVAKTRIQHAFPALQAAHRGTAYIFPPRFGETFMLSPAALQK